MATWGQNTSITGTAAALVGSPATVHQCVLIKALSGNAASVFVGLSSGVTSGTGWELAAGDEILVSKAECPDAAQLFLVAGTGTLGVCYRIL